MLENSDTILKFLAIYAILNGFFMNYILRVESVTNDYVGFAYYIKQNIRYNWIQTVIFSFLLAPFTLMATIYQLCVILFKCKNIFNRVHECEQCGYHFRLNQINYLKVSKKIYENEIFGKTFCSQKYVYDLGEHSKERFSEGSIKYTICPNCDSFSKNTKYHPELNNREILGTVKTSYKMYIKLYKNKKEAYKYLYKNLKLDEKKSKNEKKAKRKQELKEMRNELLYENNKNEIEIKKKIESVNNKQKSYKN